MKRKIIIPTCYEPLHHKPTFQQIEYSFCPVVLLLKNSYLEPSHYNIKGRDGLKIPKPSLAFKNFRKFKKDVLNLDYGHRLIECTYMIGDFYIGGTINLYDRIRAHFRNCINNKHCNRGLNKKIIELMMQNKNIPVKILSDKKDDENFFIKKYGREYGNLLNITSNFYFGV